MAGLYGGAFVEELRLGAQGLCPQWGLSPDTEVRLLNLSENATFKARDRGSGRVVVLRVYRPNYHSRREIEAELAWIEALRRDAVIATPAPLLLAEGGHIAYFDHDGETRNVVAFDFVDGREPSLDGRLERRFHRLGAISARLHRHAQAWRRPDGFSRKIWRFETMLGETPVWGDWREGLGLTHEGRAILERVAATLDALLESYGEENDRFGLVHADLRLANLLVSGEKTRVIDFDDCGFSWFAYDFAAAVSFLEHKPFIPALQRAWVEGYRTEAPFAERHVAMLPRFVMLRRMLLTAWVASHAETETARDLGEGYTAGTVHLGEAFLKREGD